MNETKDAAGGTFGALYASSHKTKEVIEQPSNQATIEATKQPAVKDSDVDLIRRTLRHLGKETASYRLHDSETAWLDDRVYELKKQGLKCDKNQLLRIAVNMLMLDYKKNKKDSVMVKTLESLNS